MENVLLEATFLSGCCHGNDVCCHANGMTITFSFWLSEVCVIRNLLCQLFWHSEKVTYQLFYRNCMILMMLSEILKMVFEVTKNLQKGAD